MKRARVFSPRRQAVLVNDISDSDTMATLRARVRQMLNCTGQNDVLVLHGEVVSAVLCSTHETNSLPCFRWQLKDGDTAGSKFENDEEVTWSERCNTILSLMNSLLSGPFLLWNSSSSHPRETQYVAFSCVSSACDFVILRGFHSGGRMLSAPMFGGG